MFFDTRNNWYAIRYDLLMFTIGLFTRKNQILMNIVYHDVIIRKITYIIWNIIYLSLLYIYMCVRTNKYVFIKGIIYMQ